MLSVFVELWKRDWSLQGIRVKRHQLTVSLRVFFGFKTSRWLKMTRNILICSGKNLKSQNEYFYKVLESLRQSCPSKHRTSHFRFLNEDYNEKRNQSYISQVWQHHCLDFRCHPLVVWRTTTALWWWRLHLCVCVCVCVAFA